MTVTTTTRRVSYAGDGASKIFAVPFRFDDDRYLRVVASDAAGAETVLALNTDYTVAGAGLPAGGTLTAVAAPASGTTLIIKRELPRLQPVDFTPNDPFPAETQERIADRLTMMAQEDDDDLNRALLLPEADPYVGQVTLPAAASRAGRALGFDSFGRLSMIALTPMGAVNDAAAIPYLPHVSAIAETVATALRRNLFSSQFATLAAAVAAAAGDTLWIDGTHVLTGALAVPDNTQLIGAGGTISTLLNSVNAIEPGHNVLLCGLTLVGPAFQEAGVDFAKGNGVYADGKRQVTVKKCTIRGFGANGVQLRNCTDYTIDDNTFLAQQWNFGTGSDITIYGNCFRGAITRNRCWSNNSQGIDVNSLGLDGDILVQANWCTPHDPATMLPYPSGNTIIRRHGIAIGYNGGTLGRIICTHNFAANVRWAGIYVQTAGIYAGVESVLVAFNSTDNCGQNAESGVNLGAAGGKSGGIFVNCGGGATLLGNRVHNTAAAAAAGITLTGSGDVQVLGNFLHGGGGVGILIAPNVLRASILNNVFLANVGADFSVGLAVGPTALGSYIIAGNRFTRTVVGSCIVLDPSTALLFQHIYDNDFVGPGVSGADANVAISARQLTFIVERNRFTGFNRAMDFVSYLPAATRYGLTAPRFDFNRITDCNVGLGIGTNAATTTTFPLEGNILVNTPTLTAPGSIGGVLAGRNVRRVGANYEVLGLTAAPTLGAWAVGDRWLSSTPASGQPKGGGCSVAGSPGTWLSDGNYP